MQILRLAIVAALSALLLSSCKDDDSQAVAPTPSPPPPAPTPAAEPEEPSLFAPINAEHKKSMKDRAEEIAEIDRRIEEAAKKQHAEFLKEVETKLSEFRDYYHKTYETDVLGGVKEYEDKLAEHYLTSLKQTETAVKQSELTILVGKIGEEIKLVEAGNKPPKPPEESDNSNPGLKLLFDLRRSYYDNYANIDKAVSQSRADLTKQYKAQLEQYHEYAKDIPPAEAGEKIATEIKWVEGEWWTDKAE